MNSNDKWNSYWESVRRAVQLGKLDHAEPLVYAALDIAEDFELEDPRLVMTLECLAEVLFGLQRAMQAEPVVKRILMIYERKYGAEHADIGIYTNNLGLLYHSQQKYYMAEAEYQKALRMQTKLLGHAHPQTLNVMANYARLLNETHRQREAKHLEDCIRGAQSGKWTQSGTFSAVPHGATGPVSPESLIAPPVMSMPGTPGSAARRREGEVTLQDLAVIPAPGDELDGKQVEVQKNSAAQGSMMQRLIKQRRSD